MSRLLMLGLATASGCATAPPPPPREPQPVVTHEPQPAIPVSQPTTMAAAPPTTMEAAPARDIAPAPHEIPSVNFIYPVTVVSTHDVELPADIKASRVEAIYPHIDGDLKQWNFDIGQRVSKGDVLAVIEPLPPVDPLEQQVKDARSAVEVARTALSIERVTLKKYESAAADAPGSVAPKEIESRKVEVANAESRWRDAQAALAKAESRAAAATKPTAVPAAPAEEKLVAPFDGIVTARNYDTGAVLTSIRDLPGQQTVHPPGTEIFDISQLDPLSVSVHLPAEYQRSVKLGQTASLTISSENRPFTGVVKQISDTPDAASNTVGVRIDFSNKDQRLFPGQFGTIRLTVSDPQPPLMIPSSAMIFQADATGLCVAVIDDKDKIEIRSIKVGHDKGSDMEVISGLSKTDKVVSNPSDATTQGTAVIKNHVAYDGKAH